MHAVLESLVQLSCLSVALAVVASRTLVFFKLNIPDFFLFSSQSQVLNSYEAHKHFLYLQFEIIASADSSPSIQYCSFSQNLMSIYSSFH